MNKNKKIKKKYFTTAQLLNLNVQDVYKHVQKLYQHIALQNQKIKKLKLKIKKMVNFGMISMIHLNKNACSLCACL